MQSSIPQRAAVWWLLGIGIFGVSTATLWIRLSESDEVNLAFRRLLLAAPVLWWFAWKSGQQQPLATASRAVSIAGVCLALHFGAWMASLKFLSVATSVVLVYVHPVIVYSIEVMRRPASADRWRLAGVVVTLFGTGILAKAASAEGTGVESMVGITLALVGSVAFVGYIFAGRSATRQLSTAVYTSRTYSIAALVLAVYLLISGASGTSAGLLLPENGQEWWLAAMLALFPTLLGHTPLNAALKHLPPSVVSTAFLGEVAVAPMIVWIYPGLREAPPEEFWSGGPLVVLGILTVVWRGSRDRSIDQK
ncbi:MAG: DMT family transporter [Planctomycetota bacterium]|nr:DMT family transporter [Planctomycetota bacterium]